MTTYCITLVTEGISMNYCNRCTILSYILNVCIRARLGSNSAKFIFSYRTVFYLHRSAGKKLEYRRLKTAFKQRTILLKLISETSAWHKTFTTQWNEKLMIGNLGNISRVNQFGALVSRSCRQNRPSGCCENNVVLNIDWKPLVKIVAKITFKSGKIHEIFTSQQWRVLLNVIISKWQSARSDNAINSRFIMHIKDTGSPSIQLCLQRMSYLMRYDQATSSQLKPKQLTMPCRSVNIMWVSPWNCQHFNYLISDMLRSR